MFKALLLLFLCAPSHALTLSEIRTNSRLLISDGGAASGRVRFSDTQVDGFANECQREAVAAAWPIVKSSGIELVAGTTYYGLPNTFLAIKRVTWRNRVLPERGIPNLDQTKEWETVSGAPQNFFISFASRTTLGVYPYPADSTSTGTVKVEFYAQADDMSASSDVPFNGIREFYPLHHILTYCVAGRLAAIDGAVGLANIYLQIYTQGLGRLAEVAKSRPAGSPSVTPVGSKEP